MDGSERSPAGDRPLLNALQQFTPPAHLAAIYDRSEEKATILALFLRLGLERGEWCLSLADESSDKAILTALREKGVDVDSALSSGALALIPQRAPYCEDERFVPDRMIDFLKEQADSAKAGDYAALRIAVDMDWILGDQAESKWIMEYEADLARLLLTHPLLVLCQYDRRGFSPKAIHDVLSIHPWIIREGCVCRNALAVSPEILLSPQQGHREVDRLLESIVDRHRAKLALQESEAKNRALLETIPDLIFELSRDGVFLSCKGAKEDFYLPPEEFLGKRLEEVLPEEVARNAHSHLEELLKSGTPQVFEYTLPVADQVRHNESRFVMSGDERILAIVRDITERKQAEEALKESRRTLATLMSNLPGMVYRCRNDRDWTMEFVSDGCQALTGYEPSALLQNRRVAYARLIHPGDREAVWETIQEALREKQPFRMEYRIETAAGQEKWVWEQGRGVFSFSPAGELLALEGFITDITERKKAEETLLHTSRMEATATLAGGIAHDFNNLMVGVLGNAELLQASRTLRAQERELLDAISKAAQRAGDLAQQMLAFARGGKYQPQVINLNDSIREILELQGPSLSSEIQVVHQLESQLWTVRADPAQMSQIVMSLCLNAAEAIEGSGRIIVTTRNLKVDRELARSSPRLKPGRYVVLTVEDTGCGMDEGTLAKVFEPFFTTKFMGRGLGLAAVYGIVSHHGGLITAESVKGGGTTIRIYLQATEARIRGSQSPKPNLPGGTETILLIDDEPIVLDVTRKMLQRLGYEVHAASDGKEALEFARTFKGAINLAVLDMGMPVLGGAETFPLLKEIRPEMKVIICSGYDLDDAAQALLDAGASAFVQKPFRARGLATQIRRALDADRP